MGRVNKVTRYLGRKAARHLHPLILLPLLILLILTSCKTKKSAAQSPVLLPETHERTEVELDSVHVSDCTSETTTTILQEVDSSYLADLGIVNPPKKAWLLKQTKDRKEKSNVSHKQSKSKATADSVPKAIPVVEQKEVNILTWWQKGLIMIGSIVMIGFVVYIAIRWL